MFRWPMCTRARKRCTICKFNILKLFNHEKELLNKQTIMMSFFYHSLCEFAYNIFTCLFLLFISIFYTFSLVVFRLLWEGTAKRAHQSRKRKYETRLNSWKFRRKTRRLRKAVVSSMSSTKIAQVHKVRIRHFVCRGYLLINLTGLNSNRLLIIGGDFLVSLSACG